MKISHHVGMTDVKRSEMVVNRKSYMIVIIIRFTNIKFYSFAL